MGPRVYRALGALATLVGCIWIISRLPAHPGNAPIGLALLGLAVAGLAHLFVVGRRIVAASTNAIAALAKRDFAATHTFLSRRNDVLIACDAQNRVALCEVGRSGVVLTTFVMLPDELVVEAHEDGRPLDEARPADAGTTGKLVLRVTYRKRHYELVFCDAVPRPADSGSDWKEYEKIRGVAAWWRDTLSGRTPTVPYRFSSQLSLHAGGPAVDALSPELLGNKLPKARVVDRG